MRHQVGDGARIVLYCRTEMPGHARTLSQHKTPVWHDIEKVQQVAVISGVETIRIQLETARAHQQIVGVVGYCKRLDDANNFDCPADWP